MSLMNKQSFCAVTRLLPLAVAVIALLLSTRAYASAPGIQGTSFSLDAHDGYSIQPDGAMVYSWGYGCASTFKPTYAPAVFNQGLGFCPQMQIPAPTLIVTENQVVTVTLQNNLPAPAGSTSILFPGFTVTATCVSGTCQKGVLAPLEAAHGATVQYQFTATTPGTHPYYSGTQSDLQIEMGMYGAVVVLPARPATNCTIAPGTGEFKLSTSAYDATDAASNALPSTCYDREYLFQWAEMDPHIHRLAEQQVQAALAANTTAALNVPTEPYHPAYFLINGRSMPDDMDADYAPNYPNQPYNGNPHMHPGELVLLRTIGQGHWQHPFHEHANHVRILARDGNLIVSQTDQTKLAGRLEFNTDTTPGQAFDGIFYYSARGLNWDIYGHGFKGDISVCHPDANGYYTVASGAAPPTFDAAHHFVFGAQNYYEWCADHNKPLETNPIGQVASGGPATLPDPLIVTNGLWYNGTPYLGPDAVGRSRGPTPLPPSSTTMNPPEESGIAFMWHSHNEREITTNDIFPGGMLMMMLVDPPVFFIDETL
jgi:FtsP/CotA-like multicopper oxidase with cupredoxin domain